MLSEGYPSSRLEAKRREQTPQALARLALLLLFMALWGVLRVAQIPMPFPFLLLLLGEAFFFIVYLRFVFVLPNVHAIEIGHYAMLAAEIAFHTGMVYFLGGISWLGAFAYVFGLIFSNAFLDLRRGLVYTAGASMSFGALIVLEATGVIPHYVYMDQGPLRYQDPQVVATTLIGATGVFVSIYAWVNWVGYQLRQERDVAINAQNDLLRARAALQHTNVQLEERVKVRTTEIELANAALRDSEQQLNLVLETCPDLIAIQEPDGRYRFVNSAFATVLGYKPEDLVGQNPAELIHPDDLENIAERFRTMVSSRRASAATCRFRHADGHWVTLEANGQVLVDAEGEPTGVVIAQRDVTERKRAESLLSEQRRVLEMIAVGAPEQSVLETLVRMIEEQAEGVMCSVCLINEDSTRLIPAVAPTLPELFKNALQDGVPIGPKAASCGTAAYRRQPVVCVDIASDPLWDDYRNAALNSGIQACWSTPIFSTSGAVLGAFAMYYKEPRGPVAHEHVLVAAAAHLGGIAIERKRAEEALRESEGTLKATIESTADGILVVGHEGKIIYANDRFFTIWRVPAALMNERDRDKLLGYAMEQLEDPDAAFSKIRELYQSSREDLDTLLFKDGRALERYSRPLIVDGVTAGRVWSFRDITERKHAEEALRESETKFRAMAETVAAAVFIFQGAKMRYVNPAAESMTGFSKNQLLAMNFWDVVHPEFREAVREQGLVRQRGDAVPRAYEIKLLTSSTQEKWVDFTAGVVDFEGEPAVLGTAFDITERKRAEAQLQEVASRDPLTGLLNRRAGLEAIEQRLQIAKTSGKRFAMMVLDLDKFKSINDTYNHETGDAALVRFAQVMSDLVEGQGVICRLGGDEFEIGLDGASLEQALIIAERLRAALRRSLQSGAGRLPEFKVSAGVACYPEDGAGTAELGRRADEAMYAAKSSGGDRCRAWRHLSTQEAA